MLSVMAECLATSIPYIFFTASACSLAWLVGYLQGRQHHLDSAKILREGSSNKARP